MSKAKTPKPSKKTKTKDPKCKASRKKNRIGKHKAPLPIIKVSARTKLPEFVENPKYNEDVNSYLKHGKYLLLINGDREEIETAITFIVGKISDKRGKIIEEILRIKDCANKVTKELLDNILSHKLENKAVVLHDISKKNIGFLMKIRLWFLGKESPLIIATLKKGKGRTYSPKEFREIFGIIKLSSQTKKQKEYLKTGGKEIYLPDKELKPLLEGILKEYKGFSHSLSDLAEIARDQIKKDYGLRIRKKDLKEVEYYGVSRLRTFISNLRNGLPLRYKKSS